MKNVIRILLCMILISGCAPLTFVKADFTQSEYNRDIYQCKLDARRSGPYGNSIMGFREIVSECMIARGYSIK